MAGNPTVGGACPVLVDGGVRSGTDVFAALAVGADAVLLGRPAIWALARYRRLRKGNSRVVAFGM